MKYLLEDEWKFESQFKSWFLYSPRKLVQVCDSTFASEKLGTGMVTFCRMYCDEQILIV